jgi:hypothetical protein
VLYDVSVNPLTPAEAFRAGFVTTLPAMLLAPKWAAQWFQIGWSHDPRFFDLYLVPWTVLGWVYDKTGWWGGQGYAVAIQETAIGVVAAGAVASILKRSSVWQTKGLVRGLVAVIGTLVPWWQMLEYLGGPDYYRVALAGFSVAYGLSVAGAFLLSKNQLLQGGLLLAALLIGLAVTAWQMPSWGWLHSGYLLASFGLLIYSVSRVVTNENVV